MIAYAAHPATLPLPLTTMAETLRTLTTPDGRTLAYALWGARDGFPVLTMHGTPGCRLDRWPREELYTELDVCLVTHDRAGYGHSTRRPGRAVIDEVDDVVALANELGFERFAVTGTSGGGPHALACAALLPDRVIRAVCSVGVTPIGAEGLEREEWLDGMDPENVKEFGWAVAGEEILTRELEREQAKIERRVADDPATVLGDFDLSESDRAQLRRPEMAQIIRESVFEQAANGVWGWVDDDLEFVRPWGFDVRSIAVPVLVRYGETDVLVPARHGRWLAENVPEAVAVVNKSAGHLGADPEREIAENVAWLRDGVAPPSAS